MQHSSFGWLSPMSMNVCANDPNTAPGSLVTASGQNIVQPIEHGSRFLHALRVERLHQFWPHIVDIRLLRFTAQASKRSTLGPRKVGLHISVQKGCASELPTRAEIVQVLIADPHPSNHVTTKSKRLTSQFPCSKVTDGLYSLPCEDEQSASSPTSFVAEGRVRVSTIDSDTVPALSLTTMPPHTKPQTPRKCAKQTRRSDSFELY